MDFYISSTGNNSNPGTQSSPWLTLAHAQTYIRTLLSGQSTDIRVNIIDSLPITSTLNFTNSDSGQNGHTVTWQGGTLNAGTRINDWSVFSGNIYRAAYSGANMRSIWVNGERCFRSRSYGKLISGLTLTSSGYSGATGYLTTDPNPENIEFLYNIYDFSHSRNCVTGVSGGTVSMIQNPHTIITGNATNLFNIPIPYDIENVYGYFISNARPGTFYYDQANSYIYYIPRPSEDLSVAEVIASNGLETSISCAGVSNVNFNQINFRYNTWNIQTDGYASISQGFYYPLAVTPALLEANDNFYGVTVPPSVIYRSGCTNVHLTNSVIKHIDNVGVHVTLQSNACTTIGNIIQDVTSSGIIIGDQLEGPAGAYCTGIITQNNIVKDIGVNFLGAIGIYAIFQTLSDISHNYVENCPYIGIAFGLGLSQHESWQTNLGVNTINNNRVLGTDWNMFDGGAIYTQSPTGGLTISGNWVTYTNETMILQSGYSTSNCTAGIYGDSGSSNLSIFNNLTEQTGIALFFNNDGSLGANNVVGTNYCDTSLVYGNAAITSYTAPTVSAIPSVSQPSIAANAGLQLSYAKLLVENPISFDWLVGQMTPLAWWKNNDSGSAAVDSSGNGYNMTRSGGYSANEPQIFPYVGRTSLGFDGISASESTSVNTPFNFETGKPFTAIALINPNFDRTGTFSAYDVMGNLDNNQAGTPGWELFFINGNSDNSFPKGKSVLGFQVLGTGQASYIGSNDHLNGTPYLIATVYDGSSTLQGIKIYTNGIYNPHSLNMSDTMTGTVLSGNNVEIGNRKNLGTGLWFNGNIGDVIIFPYELTQNQIRKMYLAAQNSLKPNLFFLR